MDANHRGFRVDAAMMTNRSYFDHCSPHFDHFRFIDGPNLRTHRPCRFGDSAPRSPSVPTRNGTRNAPRLLCILGAPAPKSTAEARSNQFVTTFRELIGRTS